MSGSGNPQLYRPCDVFTAMGRCWVLEDEFSYSINPNLRNIAYVHNTMRQEWAWLLHEQEMFYDELVGYKLLVPRRLASQMPRDTIKELRKALNCIREESDRMKIRLNRYQTQVDIRESVECKLYEHAQYMQSLLADPINQSDVEMSDEE
ncbi:hypothetical protein SO802_006011 [Lithocarpus litseifolius]|uniref:Uncharacterized protein n=1 Tax=Lithocarpus litseifolius TaxID=425828 RepID=A0AAW2DMM0_9ROSI